MNRNDELYHYGVLGMKWGIHRARSNAKKASRLRKKAESNPDKADKLNARAAKLEAKSTYTYKSHATKKYTRKANKIDKKLAEGNLSDKKREKLSVKSERYKYRAKRSADIDRNEQAYAERVNAGANIALRLLTGGNIGGKKYQQLLAMRGAVGKGNKLAKYLIAKDLSTANNGQGKTRIGVAIEKAAYLRTGEKEHIDNFKKKKG